jgi:hypothetical protein
MAATVVLERIATWERSGAIDHALADRLRALEAADATSEPGAEPSRSAIVPGASSTFILEFFAYLGGLFVLLAWYAWFVVELPAVDPERSLSIAVAALVPAVAGGVGGWALASGADARIRRAAAIALAVAVPNAGVAAWFLLEAAGVDAGFTTRLVGTVAALVVAIAGRARRPSAITQVALLAAWGFVGLGVMMWVQDSLWSTGGGPGDRGTDTSLQQAANLLWWWAVAAVPAIVLRVRPDRAPGHEARDAVTRIAIGGLAVLGTALALGANEEVAPWLAATALMGVGCVFVVAAGWSGSRIHLVTAGAGIILGLSYLNAEYVAGSAGTAVALLVEGAILLGVSALGWVGGRYVTRRRRSVRDGLG